MSEQPHEALTCSQARNALLLQESAEASDALRSRLAEHLSACAACREEAQALRSTLGTYRTNRVPAAPPLQVRHRLVRESAALRRGKILHAQALRLGATAVATAAAVLLAFAVLMEPHPQPPPHAPDIGQLVDRVDEDLQAADALLDYANGTYAAGSETLTGPEQAMELLDAFASELRALEPVTIPENST